MLFRSGRLDEVEASHRVIHRMSWCGLLRAKTGYGKVHCCFAVFALCFSEL